MSESPKEEILRKKEMVLREYGIKELSYEEQDELLKKDDKSWPLFRDAIKAEFEHCTVGDFALRVSENIRASWLYAISAVCMYSEKTKVGSGQGQMVTNNLKTTNYRTKETAELVKMSKSENESLKSVSEEERRFTKEEMYAMQTEIKNIFANYQMCADANYLFNCQDVSDFSLLFADSDYLEVDYPRGRSISTPTRRITSNLKISSFYDRSLLEGDSMPSEETFSKWFAFDRLLDNQLNNVQLSEDEIKTLQDQNKTKRNPEGKLSKKDKVKALKEKRLHIKTKVAQILNADIDKLNIKDKKLKADLQNLKNKISDLKASDLASKLESTFGTWSLETANVEDITVENARNNMPDKNRILYIIHTDEAKLTEREKRFKEIFLGDYQNSAEGLVGSFASAPEPNINAENFILTDDELKLVQEFDLQAPTKEKIESMVNQTYSNCVSALQKINYPDKWLADQQQKAKDEKFAQIPKIVGAVGLACLGAFGAFAAMTFATVVLGPVLAIAAAVVSAVAGLVSCVALVVSAVKKVREAKQQLEKDKARYEQLKSKNALEKNEKNLPNEKGQAPEDLGKEAEKNKGKIENNQSPAVNNNYVLNELPNEKLEVNKEENENTLR